MPLFNRLEHWIGKILHEARVMVCAWTQRAEICVITGLAGWLLSVLLIYTTSTMLVPVVMPILIVEFLCGMRTGVFSGLMVLPGYLLLSIWSGVSVDLIWSTPLDLACMLILGGCGALTGYMHDVIHRLSQSPKDSTRGEAQMRIHQMRLRALTARLSLDDERKRYVLTQNVLQETEKTGWQINQALQILSEQVNDADEEIRTIQSSVTDSMLNLQTQMAMISPPMLFTAGLESTLAWLVHQKMTPLHSTFNTPIRQILPLLIPILR